MLKGHEIQFILQAGPKKIKQLPEVPLLKDLVKDPRERAALKVLDPKEEAGRPVLFPPGVPDYLVKALCTAFDETVKEPKVLAEAHDMHINPHPITGEQVEKVVQQACATPKDIIALTAKLWPSATATAAASAGR